MAAVDLCSEVSHTRFCCTLHTNLSVLGFQMAVLGKALVSGKENDLRRSTSCTKQTKKIKYQQRAKYMKVGQMHIIFSCLLDTLQY